MSSATKIILAIVMALISVKNMHGQVTPAPAGKSVVKPKANGKVPVLTTNQGLLHPDNQADRESPWVDIYEFPDYHGRKVRFVKSAFDQQLVLPFIPDRVSIKRCRNSTIRILLYETSSTFPTEVKEDVPNRRINNSGITGIKIEQLNWVEIFEFPDFKGRSVRISETIPFKENLGLPFVLSEFSLKVSAENMLVGLSGNCGSARGFKTVDRNMNRVRMEGTVCGLRISYRNGIRMKFNGFLTDLHNRDCMRMYGTVKIRLVDKAEPGTIRAVYGTVDESRMDYDGWVTVFSREKTEVNPFPLVFDINRYAVDAFGSRSTPQNGKGRLAREPLNEDKPYELFYLDSLSFLEGTMKIQVKVNIGAHHKSCDLCTDYTDNVAMSGEQIVEYPVNTFRRGGGFVQAGNFRVIGGVGGFTGPGHNTFIDFSYTHVGFTYSKNWRP